MSMMMMILFLIVIECVILDKDMISLLNLVKTPEPPVEQSAQKPTACLKWEKDGFLKFHALPTICPSFLGMAPKTLTAYFTFVCFQFFLFIFDALLTICLYLLLCPFKCQHSFPVLFLVVVSLFVIFFWCGNHPSVG